MERPLPDPREAMRILAQRRSAPARKPSPRLAKSLKGLLAPLDARFGPGVGALESHWPDIVGAGLAGRTRPLRLRAKTLEVAAPGPVATLVQHQTATIMARANRFLGEGAVTKVRIIQTAASRPAALVARPGPADAAIEAQLAGQVEGVDNPVLKAALLRLARAQARKT